MPPIPYSAPDLSDDELKTLGLITVNWGTIEVVTGHALARLYKIDDKAAKKIIHPLDLARKIEALTASKDLLPSQAQPYLTELRFAQDNFKGQRNIYSHGAVVTGDDQSRRIITGKGQEADPADLPLLLEQSKYTLLVAARLLASLLGQGPFPPLPDKPA